MHFKKKKKKKNEKKRKEKTEKEHIKTLLVNLYVYFSTYAK